MAEIISTGFPRTPKLSIVIPTYNRAILIGRAIKSCVANTRADLEVIVVDDASQDNTSDVLKGFDDKRIIFVRLENNSGVCAARNRGVREASAAWVAFLDSDDEFTPDFFDALMQSLSHVPENIGGFYSRRKMDDGTITPTKISKHGVLSYADYLAMASENYGPLSDVVSCMRKETFSSLPWPERRVPEIEYHFEFAKQFGIFFGSEVLALTHQDATDRLTNAGSTDARTPVEERDRIESFGRILRLHGQSLKLHGHRLWEILMTRYILLSLLFGSYDDVQWALTHMKPNRPSAKLQMIIILGSQSPGLLRFCRSAYFFLKSTFRKVA